MPNNYTGNATVGGHGLTEQEKFNVRRIENAKQRQTESGISSGQRAADASFATTILQRERLLSGKSLEATAKRLKIAPDRLERLENSLAMTLLPGEAASLQRVFHESADLLLSENTDEHRARLKRFI